VLCACRRRRLRGGGGRGLLDLGARGAWCRAPGALARASRPPPRCPPWSPADRAPTAALQRQPRGRRRRVLTRAFESEGTQAVATRGGRPAALGAVRGMPPLRRVESGGRSPRRPRRAEESVLECTARVLRRRLRSLRWMASAVWSRRRLSSETPRLLPAQLQN
jgi:hypothetical protein